MDGVRKGLGWSVGEHELTRRVIRELLESYWMMTINLFVRLMTFSRVVSLFYIIKKLLNT